MTTNKNNIGYILTKAIDDETLDIHTKLVYFILCSHREGQKAEIKTETIADLSERSPQQTEQSLKKLEQKNYITITADNQITITHQYPGDQP